MQKLVAHALLRDAAYQHASTPVISGQTMLTYAGIYERAVRLASSLHRLGVRPGTVVGVIDVNTYRYFELHFALSMLGAVIHTVNFRLPLDTLIWTLQHAKDEWLFIGEGFGDLSATLAPVVGQVVRMGGSPAVSPDRDYEELITDGTDQEPDITASIDPSDPFSLFYTTGTTGRPKGIRYTHQQMLSGALQIAHHLGLYDTGAHLSAHDVMMPLIPFFHIHGWGAPFIAPYIGAALVLPERSDPAAQRALIHRHRVTWSNMVPTQLVMLLDGTADPLPLKVLTGGSPLASGLAHRADSRGVRFSLIYGGSDQLGSAISTAPGLSGAARVNELASRVTPFPMVRMEIRDAAGQPVPVDGASLGEAWIESPWLPTGYVDNAEASNRAYVDGWFRSGDLAVRYPDGRIAVMDRLNDAIKSGGEWIAGSTIESVISEIPGVHGVAVIGIADARWGERPKAIIAADRDVSTSLVQQALNEAVQQGRLAKFWLPDTLQFVETLPMTSAGKINKAKLREIHNEQ